MPTPKTEAETTVSRRIPRTLNAELQALQEAIEAAPMGHVPPSASELLMAAVTAGLPLVRAAYGQPAAVRLDDPSKWLDDSP